MRIIYNMKRFGKKQWTEAENKLLLEYYYTLSRPALRDILPGRNDREIQQQVSYLTKRNRVFQTWV